MQFYYVRNYSFQTIYANNIVQLKVTIQIRLLEVNTINYLS